MRRRPAGRQRRRSRPAPWSRRQPAELLVQTGTFLSGAEDVGELVVGRAQTAGPVYMSDVADGRGRARTSRRATSGTARDRAARSRADHGQTQPAVTLAIAKKPGDQRRRDRREGDRSASSTLQGSVHPRRREVSITRNYGETADDKAKKLIQKLIFATASVVLLVLFALGWREALIVGAAVIAHAGAHPVRLVGVGLHAQPRLAVRADLLDRHPGRRRHRGGREHPPPPCSSAARPARGDIPRAVDEVGGPTILATFTVIAALLPMAFVTGLMGPYMSPIPINASLGMLISLASPSSSPRGWPQAARHRSPTAARPRGAAGSRRCSSGCSAAS